jgi:hypothetical protein
MLGGSQAKKGRDATAARLTVRRRARQVGDWVQRSRSAVAYRRPRAGRLAADDAAGVEGLVVLGMHRSGTSLVTRLVSLLGLAVCRDEDLLVGYKGNPRGHWESQSLIDLNDRLLDELGGTWFCPPALDAQRTARILRRHGPQALDGFLQAHPQRPWVWKDPRACVLLPFWSAVLAKRAAYVLVVRHPLEVSDSLARRNGCSPQFSLALWERYTRQAMLGAAGRPMMVCTYDEVLTDPVDWCERLLSFLAQAGVAPADAVDWGVVGAYAMDGLRHSHRSWAQLEHGSPTSSQQLQLAQVASRPVVEMSYAPPPLPEETPTTESIFTEIRGVIAKRSARQRHLLVDLPDHLLSDPAVTARAQAASRPPVSVVLAGAGVGVEATVALLVATLPAGSEMLVVGQDFIDSDALSAPERVSLRLIDCDRPPGQAQALALGADAARGDIVVLAGDSLLRSDQWYPGFRRRLAHIQMAGVGPVMRLETGRGRYFGRAFVDEDLRSDLVAGEIVGDGGSAPAAALLSEVFSAYDRRVLAAAGGVDGCFCSSRAAVAELSVRLWRMGFHCCIAPQVQVWSGDALHDDDAGAPGGEREVERLHDRMRIAALHFDAARLSAFTDRARSLPEYARAAERLTASDVEHRRALLATLCAFPIERYYQRFAPIARVSAGRRG